MRSFADLVRMRYSVRTYESRPVEKEKIERCLESARLAPSACNAQPWSFVVADEPELVKRLAAKTLLAFSKMNRFVEQAPVIVAVIGERPNLSSQVGSAAKRKPLFLMDIGMAAEHFALQAADEGLGACHLGWFDEKAVKKIMGIPPGKRVYLLITLGYPGKDGVPEKMRKPLADIVSWNRWK